MAQPKAVYHDDFLDTLTVSHRAVFRAELYYNDGTGPAEGHPPGRFLKELGLVGGSITADRSATVRRTAQIQVDPSLVDDVRAGTLSAYGYYVKLYRGVQYISGDTVDENVFTGRIEQIDVTFDQIQLTCSDLAADLVDAKFEAPYTVAFGYQVIVAMTNIILDVNSGFQVIIDTANTNSVPASALYEQDRQAALDDLAASISCEWFADMYGRFHVADVPQPLTALPPGAPTWIVDTGSSGVLVTRQLNQSRTEVFNAVIASGESLYGVALTAIWKNEDPDDPLRYGGPFGKVAMIMDPNTALASPESVSAAVEKQGKLLKLAAQNVTIECVPNPKLQLSEVIEIRDDRFGLSGFYFVTGFELPMQPDTVMRITAMKAM